MYRKTILPMDAIVAVSLVDLSMQDCTLKDTVDALHSTVPKYPDYDYLCTAKKLLTRLNLIDVWLNELLYYAKLLQVDHKTLEADIEAGNCKLFAKHEDVTDDNIQLSASLITSSYFNNKKSKKNHEIVIPDDKDNPRKDKDFKDDGINERFAVTLKKHKALNNMAKEPPSAKKKAGKRKRKEVTVDSTGVKNKLIKKGKNTKREVHIDEDQESNSDEEFLEDRTVLNAVPSVNDALADLGIDFHFEKDSGEIPVGNNIVKSEPKDLETSNEVFDTSVENYDSILDISVGGETKKNTEVKERTVSKLKQFQFVSKHDFDKYDDKPAKFLNISSTSFTTEKTKLTENNTSANISYDKPSTSKTPLSIFEGLGTEKCLDSDSNHVTAIANVKGKENHSISSNQKLSNPSSQISMFESSDCDIDLDL